MNQQAAPGDRRDDGRGTRLPSDGALLAQVAAGSQAALEALYQRHETRLYRFLLGMLGGDQGRAGEITCETFFEVWKQAATFRGDSSVVTWIFSIARHRAVSALRRTRPTEGEGELAHVPAGGPDPLEMLSSDQAASRVRRALEQLSPEHREVLELACYHDLPYPEIAMLIGCPVNTVKTRAFYGRQQLKRALQVQR